MIPERPLPYPDGWASTDDYIENILDFATTSEIFQTLCGGVHILDFFTNKPGLFQVIVPPDWQKFLLECDSMRLLDVFMRENLDELLTEVQVPGSLLEYMKSIRKFSLARNFSQTKDKLPKLTRMVAVGMKPKKVHEVSNFASFVDSLAADLDGLSGESITHFVDFGSGQNYLGRALASSPYNRHIIAVEGREHNIAGAKELDMLAGIAEKEKVMRNKKAWAQMLETVKADGQLDQRAATRAALALVDAEEAGDFRPTRELTATYRPEDGKGFIRYVSGRLESGDLSDVVDQVQSDLNNAESPESTDLRLMAISIHSCGNLSHHGIRSLIMNPHVRAVAIVGCCYNLLTEKLGPPTYKLPYLRPSLQPLNGRIAKASAAGDPQGFPMSERMSTYRDNGIRFNITARMMACQAPQNWSEKDSDDFFTRHFFRAVLQKIFLDKGVISKVHHDPDHPSEETAFNTSTNPIIIGSLRKGCYTSLRAYVRGAITKLTTHSEYHEQCDAVADKMSGITDDEIAEYERLYRPRKRELSAIWSLMAFSAGVVESLIVTDRWLFLKQHGDVVDKCWVETVFDYKESPRNLVVVGVKKRDAR